jgi:hypothetical protein
MERILGLAEGEHPSTPTLIPSLQTGCIQDRCLRSRFHTLQIRFYHHPQIRLPTQCRRYRPLFHPRGRIRRLSGSPR